MTRTRTTTMAGLLALSLAAGCDTAASYEDVDVAAAEQGALFGKRPRNVILFIGDGMGPQQVSFLNQYRRLVTPDAPPTSFERLLQWYPNGLLDTDMLSVDGTPSLTVDSAASATQMACGIKTITQVIGLDRDGYPCETVLERAHAVGKATGLITDTRITHATPAAFAGKQPKRSLEREIAHDMISGVSAGKIDVLLGGGARYLIPQGTRMSDVPACAGIAAELDGSSSRKDDRSLIDEAVDQGYHFACDAAQLAAVPEIPGTQVLGLFARSGYPGYPERWSVAGLPSLPEMTEKAVRVLEQDPRGFFLMVEAGQIDWAGHDNDGAYMLGAMRDADDTLAYLMDYVHHHPNTLLIVTADHETGGMGFSYRQAPDIVTELPSGLEHVTPYDFADAAAKFALLEAQTMSFMGIVDDIAGDLYLDDYEINPDYPLADAVADLRAAVAAHTPWELSEDQAVEVLYVAPGTGTLPQAHAHDAFVPHDPFHNRLAHQFVDHTQLVWATGTHTSTPVQVFAMGPLHYSLRVLGYHHNSRVGQIIFDALGD